MKNRKKAYFPSYNHIYGEIKSKYEKAYTEELSKLNHHIHRLKTTIDFDK